MTIHELTDYIVAEGKEYGVARMVENIPMYAVCLRGCLIIDEYTAYLTKARANTYAHTINGVQPINEFYAISKGLGDGFVLGSVIKYLRRYTAVDGDKACNIVDVYKALHLLQLGIELGGIPRP
jgi:hypothetical protein